MCRSVEVEGEGEAVVMMLCNSNVCRSWSAIPVNEATLFQPNQVKITKGEEFLNSFYLSERHNSKWYNKCGRHLLTDHTNTYGIIDVYGSILDNFIVKLTAHVNYENSILPIKNGLPKFKFFPKDFRSSGVLLEE